MREFVPFDDGWFDDDPPGPLVPLPLGCTCVRTDDGTFHWVRAVTPDSVIASPLCNPSLRVVPALSSST